MIMQSYAAYVPSVRRVSRGGGDNIGYQMNAFEGPEMFVDHTPRMIVYGLNLNGVPHFGFG